jgi:nucleotide-binding universal stress UspA family protein
MSFKTILSVIGVDHKDGDLKLAAALCTETNAHLSILVLAPSAPIIVGTYGDVMSDAWVIERQTELKRLKERSEAATAFAAASGLSSDVASEYCDSGALAEMVGRRARYADLIVLGPTLLADGNLKNHVLDGSLFRSGRPALVLAKGKAATLKPKTVVVAWDGSKEAARAVADSVDMLRHAKDVRLVMVDPSSSDVGNGAEPGADQAAYLARCGVTVTVERIPAMGGPVSEALQRFAGDCNADMIVMGAYGHSRLRERIFGGVTVSMIDAPDLPTLMAH